MNRLIKELEKHALDYAACTLVDNEVGGIARFNDLFTEKFAELIIRECIGLADMCGAGGAGSDFDVGYISCAEALKEEIKEHFGVE